MLILLCKTNHVHIELKKIKLLYKGKPKAWGGYPYIRLKKSKCDPF